MLNTTTSAQNAGKTMTVPTINGRRTLLIGLGSTGAQICNQILERLTWTYDSPDNVPWLKCIVLETMAVGSERLLHKSSRSIHLKIDRRDYEHLIRNPDTYHDTLDFSSWDIPSLTANPTVMASGVLAGANNTRILGRLALLHPDNFRTVRTTIMNELDSLGTGVLTADKASKAFARGLRHSNRTDVVLDDNIYVYVVGTLCGGTASGSFIDLGYMLQELPGRSVTSTGIFSIPASASSNSVLLANAYAALVEINHFSSDRTKYTVQHPTSPGSPYSPMPGTTPYGMFYLAQPSGAAALDIAKLTTAMSDYVYYDIIGSSASDRDAARTNITSFFTQKDRFGATQKFFTFGLGSVEFPYTKVAKACNLRLTKLGFQNFASGIHLSQSQQLQFLNEVPLSDRNNLDNRLLSTEDQQIATVFDQVVTDAKSTAQSSDTAFDMVEEQIGNTFEGGSSSSHPKLPSRLVPLTIDANENSSRQELKLSVESATNAVLQYSSNHGINALLDFYLALEARLTASISDEDVTMNDSVAEAKSALDQVKEQIRECREDFWLGIVLLKSNAVSVYVDKYVEHANQLHDLQLHLACEATNKRLLRETLIMVQSIRTRLENSQCGLVPQLNNIVAKLDDLYRRTDAPSGTSIDGWTRTVNGKELFTPDQTVKEEYIKCIRDAATKRDLSGSIEEVEKRLGRDAIQGFIKDMVKTIFSPVNSATAFDPLPDHKLKEYDDESLFTMTDAARSSFEPLKARSIIDRLMSSPQSGTIIDDAKDASQLFLEWSPSHARYVDIPNKSYGFVFFNQEDPLVDEFVDQLQAKGVIDPKTKPMNVADRHQIMILHEQGAFSLGTVGNLIDEMPSHWRDVFSNPGILGLDSFHSRGDISEWTTWSRAEEGTSLRNLFLVGVAVGIIKFQSASQYLLEYTKKSIADPGKIQLSNDLDEASQKLKLSRLKEYLELKIREKRAEYGSTGLVDKLALLISESDGKFVEGEGALSSGELEAYLLDYVRADSELFQIYTTEIVPDSVIQSYLKPDGNGGQAYFCPHCRKMLGSTADALYVQVRKNGKSVRERRCTYADCKKPL